MTWATALGLLSALAVVVVLAPWGAGAPARTFDAASPEPRAPGRTAPRRRKRRDAVEDALEAQRYLEGVARSVRAGRTLTASFDLVATPGWLEPVRRRLGRGRTLAQALHDTAPGQRDPPGRHLVHRTLLTAATAGAGPAMVLDHAATLAADRVAARQERRAQAAQARLSATVLTWVPVGVATLAIVGDSDVRRVMLTTPVGLICGGAGGALSMAGRRWIRRITEDDAP
jgi:Flp pilus assembly protein TadB